VLNVKVVLQNNQPLLTEWHILMAVGCTHIALLMAVKYYRTDVETVY